MFSFFLEDSFSQIFNESKTGQLMATLSTFLKTNSESGQDTKNGKKGRGRTGNADLEKRRKD